jgi:hypothetical protein
MNTINLNLKGLISSSRRSYRKKQPRWISVAVFTVYFREQSYGWFECLPAALAVKQKATGEMHPWPGSPSKHSENQLAHSQQAHPYNFFAKHNDPVYHMFAPPFRCISDKIAGVYHRPADAVK